MTTIRKRNSGLTMIELLVVITIASILAFFAVPDLSDFVKNNRSASDVNDLVSSLTYARSEAVKLNSSVSVCQSANGATCENTAGAWGAGWLVFEDRNRDGAVDSVPMRISSGIGTGRTLSFSATRVTYRGNGLAVTGTNETFTLCDDRGAAYAKGVIVGPSGRPRAATVAEDEESETEFPVDADGDALSCGESSDPSDPEEPSEA